MAALATTVPMRCCRVLSRTALMTHHSIAFRAVGGKVSHWRRPRSVDFQAELPRHPTGKLYKRLLKDRYWQGHTTRVL